MGENTILCGTSSRPDGIFRLEVIDILRVAGVAREEVVLAELVVLQPAVGVVETTAPAARHALLELEDRRVILILAKRRPSHEDVIELRERAQRLSARDRGAGDVESLSRRQPEERVRHWIVQRRSERQMPWIELVDVQLRVGGPAEQEVATRRAGVLEPDGDAAAELTRDVDRVLVDFRRGSILIDEDDLLADVGQRRRGSCRLAAAGRWDTGWSSRPWDGTVPAGSATPG